MRRVERAACCAIALNASVWCSPTQGQVTFRGLGAFPGGTGSHADAVSGDGSIVVGYARTAATLDKPFRWTRAIGLQELAPGTYSPGSAYALAISANGTVIAGYGNFLGSSRAFRWTEPTGMTPLAMPVGSGASEAQGISGDGQVIVGTVYTYSSQQRPVRWDASGAVHLIADIPATALYASFDGSVVIGNYFDGQHRPFRWDETGGFRELPELTGSWQTLAQAVSADGRVIVGGSAGLAVLWDSGRIASLGTLPGHVSSYASAVTPDGSVVVGASYTGVDSIWHPFLWTQRDGMRDIFALLAASGYNLSDWRSLRPSGVSADGRTIVGTGLRYSGLFAYHEAWVVVIPAPAASTFGLALALLSCSRRRTRLPAEDRTGRFD